LELSARKDQSLSDFQHRQIEKGAARLSKGEPLQYILGEAEFMGRVFLCDCRALIPRPETEQLTDWMLEDAALWQSKAPVIADVGAGSGCIVVSLALEQPEGRYIATDISTVALALARENAVRHGVSARIRFIACDLLSVALPETTFVNLDAVISNPPYVRAADWAQLERSVRDFEPRAALVGGPDGLAIIRRLMAQSFQALKPGARFFWKSAKTRERLSWNWCAQPDSVKAKCGRTLPAKTGWCGR